MNSNLTYLIIFLIFYDSKIFQFHYIAIWYVINIIELNYY